MPYHGTSVVYRKQNFEETLRYLRDLQTLTGRQSLRFFQRAFSLEKEYRDKGGDKNDVRTKAGFASVPSPQQ